MRRFLATSKLYVIAFPLLLTFLGAGMNQLVLVANHDKFPVMLNSRNISTHGDVDANGMIDEIHCVMTSETHLNFMADIFDFKAAIMSPGDLLLLAGDWAWGYAPFLWAILMIGEVWRNKCLSTK